MESGANCGCALVFESRALAALSTLSATGGEGFCFLGQVQVWPIQAEFRLRSPGVHVSEINQDEMFMRCPVDRQRPRTYGGFAQETMHNPEKYGLAPCLLTSVKTAFSDLR